MTELCKRDVRYGTWLVLTLTNGAVEAVPCDNMHGTVLTISGMGEKVTQKDWEKFCKLNWVLDVLGYVNPASVIVDTVTVCEGFGARLSNAGYTDHTSWTYFTGRPEALVHLDNLQTMLLNA